MVEEYHLVVGEGFLHGDDRFQAIPLPLQHSLGLIILLRCFPDFFFFLITNTSLLLHFIFIY